MYDFAKTVERIANTLAYGNNDEAIKIAREAEKKEEDAYLLYCAGKIFLKMKMEELEKNRRVGEDTVRERRLF